MENRKNINDLFRDNQHKLDSRPHERTWRRLEQRLDNHRRNSRRLMYRQLGMAAAVLLVVGIIAVLGFWAGTRQQNAHMTQLETPVLIEDLAIDQERVVKVNLQKYYNQSPKVVEGEQGQRLKVAD